MSGSTTRGGYKAPRSLRLAGAMGLAAAALPLWAQGADEVEDDQASTVERVVLTGRKTGQPYAARGAPYKTDRSASSKLTEPLLNTPKSVTVLSEEVSADSGANTFRGRM